MYKKFLIVAVAAVFTASFAQAQFTFGARAGFNMTNVYTLDGFKDSKWKPGFQIGVVGDYALSDAFSIQPGILYATMGRKIDSKETYMGSYVETKGVYHLNYIQIPVNAQYKIDMGGMKLLLQAGPYFGYGLGGKNKYESTVDGEKLDVSETKIEMGSDKWTKAFDFGLGAGAGVQFGNIQAILGYNIGIVNLNNITEKMINDMFHDPINIDPAQKEALLKAKLKNHGLSVTLIYLFGK